ncbi:alpha-hydroxy-acid oxidizing protein [Sphingomonas solaris]|uniref:Alpha-hydroxy-acid oxidizing protein n=1 Tax=Alterirhizorhabdus solaris TaxID=2529389 RepID=A0A558QSU2_9SPHN|nr:alpha-hydroxy-acid oxidizing protein [Sphingomonas solaris]TVV70213.1 alpha-hydroxy-acid oxidizing protein [Sphingomonas solaris]
MGSLLEAPGPHRQAAIYVAGTAPAVPVDADRLRAAAQAMLSPEAFAYADGAAGRGTTRRANRHALDRWQIRPRVGRDITGGDMRATLFGRTLPVPMLLAPLGALELAHPHADLAVARAAAGAGVPMIVSSQASFAMERIAGEMADAPRWFQLYPSRSAALVESLVTRAEACGCEAIVVTLDTPTLGWRPDDLDLGHLPFFFGKGIANYLSDPVFRALLDRPPEEDLPAAVRMFLGVFANPGFTWAKLAGVRALTRLPLLVKGVTHPDDARRAIDHGVDGIIVSNHGGRQIDGAVPAVTALDEIAPVVAGQVPVLFDSGIRGGTDIFRALALGANGVLIGRPLFHALAVAGEAGVAALIANLIAEFDLTMRLAGCTAIAEIDRNMIRRGEP